MSASRAPPQQMPALRRFALNKNPPPVRRVGGGGAARPNTAAPVRRTIAPAASSAAGVPARRPLGLPKPQPLRKAVFPTTKKGPGRGGGGTALLSSSTSPPQYVWSDAQRERVRLRSYLGPRGYTLWADALVDDEERNAVRALARFQPLAPDPMRPAPPAVTLAVESDTKWFLPQAQGLALFGAPAKHALPYKGLAAELQQQQQLQFTQSLFDKQLPIVAKCIAEMQAQYARQKFAGIVLQAGCGDGKTVMGIFLAVVVAPIIHHQAGGGGAEADSSGGCPSFVDNARRLLFVDDAHAAESCVDDGKDSLKRYTAAAVSWPRRKNLPMAGAILVLVNKGFLMDQWRERILSACPAARIGRIQGKTHTVDGCHFVLGMIQTMWAKTYAPATFAGFQTVIVDEAHCICSLKYFQALRQIVTPFMIALSATVQKPNGMEEILFRYVGPIAYRAPMVPTNFRVTVRIVQYACHEDPEYSRLDYNRMGEIDYSSIMVRVSNYPPRIDAAADALLRFTQENPKTQILLLSTLKEPLVELAKRIAAWNAVTGTKRTMSSPDDDREERHRPTYGFYVGGMKMAALDESSAAQIILATYSMAAEALDIPTLDAVFLYNSKATITQPIGRPMRRMNDNKFIYDFADAHSVFQSQLFRKRMPVYRGNGYCVFKTNYRELAASSAAAPLVWRPVFLPPGASRSGGGTCGGTSIRNCGAAAADSDSEDGCAFGNDDDGDDE